jgi:pectinesterase
MIIEIKHHCLLILLFASFIGKAQVFDIVVDINGSGNFTSVQDAINSAPDNSTERTLIFVKRGIYKEKVVVPASKTNLSLIGEDPENVIISWNDYQGKDGISGADSYTMLADASGFYAGNITVENTAGNVGQAVALRTTGDTMVFNNCRFLGFQDTYYAHKRRQYNINCTVEGATDFIYGDATTVFDNCTINCVKGGRYISAPADTKLITPLAGGDFLHGLLFRYCNVTANPDVANNSFYLGRPWQAKSSSVFIKCKLAQHISAEGWSTWSGNNHLSSVFAEYKNMDTEGNLVDISQRVSWSYQLDSARVANLYKLDFFLRKDGKIWNPKRITQALSAPSNFILNGNELNWNPVENAIGYVVLANDSVIGFSASNTFSVSDVMEGDFKFDVKSVSKNGNLSKKSTEHSTGANQLDFDKNSIQIFFENQRIRFSEEVDYKIYTINGKLLKAGRNSEFQLNGFKSGIYLINATNNSGKNFTRKIIL